MLLARSQAVIGRVGAPENSANYKAWASATRLLNFGATMLTSHSKTFLDRWTVSTLKPTPLSSVEEIVLYQSVV
jgi:hypothetical protein